MCLHLSKRERETAHAGGYQPHSVQECVCVLRLHATNPLHFPDATHFRQLTAVLATAGLTHQLLAVHYRAAYGLKMLACAFLQFKISWQQFCRRVPAVAIATMLNTFPHPSCAVIAPYDGHWPPSSCILYRVKVLWLGLARRQTMHKSA